jgi:AcrR family transcriptional regulator
VTDAAEATANLTRVERKRLEARARIVKAAGDLFRAHGVDAVTIQDITGAADVGHGSFYLHFKTKTDVLLAILLGRAAELDARVQQALGKDADPALVLATSSRYVGRKVLGDELWCWLLANSGVPSESLRSAFGRFSSRDLRAGVEGGRFAVDDARASAIFCFGGYVSVLLAAIGQPDAHALIDRAAETMLRVLGLEASEAATIAGAPLPD